MHKYLAIVSMVVMVAQSVTSAAKAEQIAIAAVVNDTVITTSDLRDRISVVHAFSNVPNTPAANAIVTRKALRALMNEALQKEEAKRFSITVKDTEIDAAMARIEQARGQQPGSLKQFIKETGLAKDSLIEQLRTQVAWRKVVSRRLRRNVVVTDAEVTRAQQAEANKVGNPHVRIASIAALNLDTNDADRVAELALDIRSRLMNGEPFEIVARSLAGRNDVRLNPGVWVPENQLEPSIAAVVRTLQPGQVTEPLRSLNTFQIVQLQDRRFIKPVAPDTEIAVKQITLSLKDTQDPREMDALVQIAKEVQKNPGSCSHKAVAGIYDMADLHMEVHFLRAKIKDVAPRLLPTISALNVSEVSEPFVANDGMQMLMLCERLAPIIAAPDEKNIRNKLFAEKMELEAEKHLRNLKRDAFVDVKLDASTVL